MIKFLKAKWKGLRRRAKWLIIWSTLYAIPSAVMLTLDFLDWPELGRMGPRWDSYGFQFQIVWLVIMGSPLIIRPLGNWVFMREKKNVS